jgi:hypothetical protein
MQCERCGMQLDTGDAQTLSLQCSRCGHVNTNDIGQPVFVLDPDDSDIFSLEDKTRVDTPAVKPEAIGRIATKKKPQPSLGDMLFLDAEPQPTAAQNIPQEEHNFTSHSDIYHYDAVERLDALKLPGAESTAPHRVAPAMQANPAPVAARIPHPRAPAAPEVYEEEKPSFAGALLGAAITICVLGLLGLGLFRMTLGLTPPTTPAGLEQFIGALGGGQTALAETGGVIVSSYHSITYPTGSEQPVLLIFGEVENHRDVDMGNLMIKAELVDELGVTVATETMPIGLKFSPPDFAGLSDVHKLGEMVAIKKAKVDPTVAARSSRSWSIALASPLVEIDKLEHRISLLQIKTP